MKSNNLIGPALGLLAALTLAACGTMNDPLYGGSTTPASQVGTSGGSYPATTYPSGTYPVTTQPADTYPTQTYSGYGVVHSVERVSQAPTVTGGGGSGIGLGTVAGAVVGGLIGSQIGSGSGTTAATVVGAAGGAYVGHEIENRQQAQQVQAQPDVLKITVRMEDGSYQDLLQPLDADFRVGDRVRVGDGVLQRY
ncbi:glycine zipper 2TM domain-containing protein [Rhodocyclaceae bacterium SMB388]